MYAPIETYVLMPLYILLSLVLFTSVSSKVIEFRISPPFPYNMHYEFKIYIGLCSELEISFCSLKENITLFVHIRDYPFNY